MYQYRESGLDNVWLVNGYTVRQTEYGDTVSIDDVEELHAAIGRAICQLPRRLKAAEVRFLRKELSVSQRQLAEILEVEELTVGRWERNQNEIPGPADHWLRLLYAEKQSSEAEALNRFRALLASRLKSQTSVERLEFEEAAGDWRLAA
jgi:DNA-binding transcriptional regulator YiaG